MSIEVQIRSQTLGEIAAGGVQRRLRTSCMQAPGIDHVDVADVPVRVSQGASRVELRVTLDVYGVTRADIMAAPNAPPATTRFAVVLVLGLGVSGTRLDLKFVDIDLPDPALKTAARDAIGGLVGSDLGFMLTRLMQDATYAPTTSQVDLVGDVVAIRFDAAGAPASAHLLGGQQWGAFIDGATLAHVTEQRLRRDFAGRITSLSTEAHWRPLGTTPHVDVDYGGKFDVPVFAGNIEGTFSSEFSIADPPQSYQLRTTVHFTFAIDLGPLVPDDVAHAAAASLIEDAVKPGNSGIPLGNHTFAVDSALPRPQFGDGTLIVDSVLASATGMTLGGRVVRTIMPDALAKATTRVVSGRFTLPTRHERCSVLAEAGDGTPHRSRKLIDLETISMITLQDCGAFCGLEVLGPNQAVAAFTSAPDRGTVADEQTIQIHVRSDLAQQIDTPVRLLVITARGVRLVDLGVPPKAQLDENGDVTNGFLAYIKDCQYQRNEQIHRTNLLWGDQDGIDVDIVPAINEIAWSTYLRRQHGLSVHLVSVSGLEPGELLQFRSPAHAIDVTADPQGHVIMPVLLSPTDATAPTRLTRTSGVSIEGRVSISSAIFEHAATVALAPDSAGERRAEPADDLSRATAALESVARELAGRRAPDAPASLLGHDLDRVVAAVPIPGFADAPIAIGTLTDGSMRVLGLTEDGATRVAGTFAGPIGPLEVCGGHAVSTDADRAVLYSIGRGASAVAEEAEIEDAVARR